MAKKPPPTPTDRAEGRPLTPPLRALLLAERALEGCSCVNPAAFAALEAIRRVLAEDELS